MLLQKNVRGAIKELAARVAPSNSPALHSARSYVSANHDERTLNARKLVIGAGMFAIPWPT